MTSQPVGAVMLGDPKRFSTSNRLKRRGRSPRGYRRKDLWRKKPGAMIRFEQDGIRRKLVVSHPGNGQRGGIAPRWKLNGRRTIGFEPIVMRAPVAATNRQQDLKVVRIGQDQA